MKPSETTADAYRFEVKVAASATETFKIREERPFDETLQITSVTPDLIAVWVQNQAISAAARNQLEQVIQKKRDIASVDAQIKQLQSDMTGISQDQDRLRKNIDSLRSVAGQQEQVQNYARQLSAGETKLAGLRDSESEARKKKAALEADLNGLIEQLQF